MRKRQPILERLAAYLSERRLQGYALPDEVHALLDELAQLDAQVKEDV
jgi:hypothetical protein